MIVSPKDWKHVGCEIGIKEIEDTILNILAGIDCNCLALSGGIDSGLLLYFMAKSKPSITAFTIGSSEDHPDVVHSKMIASEFPEVDHKIYIPSSQEIEGQTEKYVGDAAVKLLYGFVGRYTDSVIAGDGIDEYMCGYYSHLEDPCESVYYDFMRKLQGEQLVPLDENSGDVEVHLPYIDSRLIVLLSQIPISEKVDSYRKMLMVKMAKNAGICDAVIERKKYGFCSALEVTKRAKFTPDRKVG